MTVSSCGLLDMLGLGNRADMWDSTFGNRRIRRPASGDTSITMATGISSHSTGMRPACMKKAAQSCSLPMNFWGAIDRMNKIVVQPSFNSRYDAESALRTLLRK